LLGMALVIAQKQNENQRVTLWDNAAEAGLFTEGNLRGEIAQRVDISLPGGRAATISLTRSGFSVYFDADTDTLNIGCDESDESESDCHAEVGSPAESSSGRVLAGNIYFCKNTRLLTQVEQFVETFSDTEMCFFVYRADEDALLSSNIPPADAPPEPGTNESFGGSNPASDDDDEKFRLSRTDFQAPFDLLAKATVDVDVERKFHSSGPMEVLLEEGRFYLIGAAWDEPSTCFRGGGFESFVPFGKLLGGLVEEFDGSSGIPDTLLPTTDDLPGRPVVDERAHYQKLTLGGAGVGPGAGGGDLLILDTDEVADLRVGTVNVMGAGVDRILTNVSIGTVVGGPEPQFFSGNTDPPEISPRYSVKVNEIVYRIRRGSPESCRCNQMFYREPTGWANFDDEAEARAHFDSFEPVPQAAIGVTEEKLDVVGCTGGPFRPDAFGIDVANVGQFPATWTAGASEPWIHLSKTGGTLANPGDNDRIEVSIEGAELLCTGIHFATITVDNETNGVGTAVRNISVEARGRETPQVIPTTGFESAGRRGGPFSPSQIEWTLTNVDDCPMDWDATNSAEEWLGLSETGGTLPAGASITVVASILTGAALLTPDRLGGRVVFRNLTSGRELVGREVSLLILP